MWQGDMPRLQNLKTVAHQHKISQVQLALVPWHCIWAGVNSTKKINAMPLLPSRLRFDSHILSWQQRWHLREDVSVCMSLVDGKWLPVGSHGVPGNRPVS